MLWHVNTERRGSLRVRVSGVRASMGLGSWLLGFRVLGSEFRVYGFRALGFVVQLKLLLSILRDTWEMLGFARVR